MLSTLKGVMSLLLYVINIIAHAVFILMFAVPTYLIPIRKWRRTAQRFSEREFPKSFARINNWIALISTQGRWDIAGTGTFSENNWYLLISNHISWIDILVLGKVFHGKIPAVKFFMKKELLWQLPFAGLACYVLGYPFMSRHSRAEIKKNPSLKGRDIETTKKACQKIKSSPTSLLNFAEGTRFTEKKHRRQESPFKNLLKPHAGGVAIVVHELHSELAGIVNVVITYFPKTPSFWAFACGRFDKVCVRYDLIPITPDLVGDYHNDRNHRPKMQQWFNQLWERNDALITQLKENHEK